MGKNEIHLVLSTNYYFSSRKAAVERPNLLRGAGVKEVEMKRHLTNQGWRNKKQPELSENRRNGKGANLCGGLEAMLADGGPYQPYHRPSLFCPSSSPDAGLVANAYSDLSLHHSSIQTKGN